MTNLSLYSVQAILILDSEGKRIHVKYYNEQLAKDGLKFEKQIYRKSKKTNGRLDLNQYFELYKSYILPFKNLL